MRTSSDILRKTILAAALILGNAALAQTTPDWRAALTDLYRIDKAFDACKNLAPSASDILRLEEAIAHVEGESGLEEDELDDLYDEVERAAEPVAQFCERMADALARVQKIPPEYR